ncbi:hypothetical protein FISHEDRAFT_42605 [Fistulina hepatica ATCC 64428]|uniref:RBR-type E3 ubiquitin transferase n=1 Tax=Fistulina hepatica ATCC 64428 TaxID=1128425 RepID=A0A0D7ACX6_9AGAR|nr:hypothetical protein FISHEDRAFT_42605 [Fistulina hepatica ATCC 64428]
MDTVGDDGILELIVQLALDDIAEVEAKAAKKGKAREDQTPTDEQLALACAARLYNEDLQFIADLRLAQSIDSALEADQPMLTALSILDQAEHDDHICAEALSRGQHLPVKTNAQTQVEMGFDLDRYVWVRTAVSLVARSSHDKSVQPLPIIQKPRVTVPAGSECVSCQDALSNNSQFIRGICGHFWCRDCLGGLVTACLTDETLFPLRCDNQAFSVLEVVSLLDRTLRSRYETKSLEFATPPTNRLYCSRPSCAAFLGSNRGKTDNVPCSTCGQFVCPTCKRNAHPGGPCLDDQNEALVRALAAQEKWQTCPNCHALVELTQGCYHMTCRCRAEFCYVCASRWKTCGCPQWEEVRLYDTAQQRVENELGRDAAQRMPAVFQQRLAQRTTQLRVNHDCGFGNHRWVYRHGGGQCENCTHVLPQYLLRCRNCAMLACVRCSRNRL